MTASDHFIIDKIRVDFAPIPSYHILDTCAEFSYYNDAGYWLFSTSITCEVDLPPGVPESENLKGYMTARFNEVATFIATYDGKVEYTAFTFTYFSTVNLTVDNAASEDGINVLVESDGQWITKTLIQQDYNSLVRP